MHNCFQCMFIWKPQLRGNRNKTTWIDTYLRQLAAWPPAAWRYHPPSPSPSSSALPSWSGWTVWGCSLTGSHLSRLVSSPAGCHLNWSKSIRTNKPRNLQMNIHISSVNEWLLLSQEKINTRKSKFLTFILNPYSFYAHIDQWKQNIRFHIYDTYIMGLKHLNLILHV